MTFVFALLFVFLAGTVRAQTNWPPNEVTLPQCLDLALKQNPAILKAQQEIRRTRGLIVEARAEILPHITATGEYRQVDPDSIDRFTSPTPAGSTNGVSIPPFKFGNDEHPWRARVEATQLVYSGGRATAGIRAAKLGDQYAVFGFERIVADTLLDVRRSFYAILLAQQQVVVREQSVTLLQQQLEDTRHRFDVGAVPKFNVLRAEVELANAKPPLIRSQNNLRLARESLVKLVGIDSPQDEPFTSIRFTGELTYMPHFWDLPTALRDALTRRPELQQTETILRATAEEIRIAQSGYKPELSVFAGYGIYNSHFSDEIDRTLHGWDVGARASWPIFDGMLARGKVTQARAKRTQSELDLADTRRGIELEVRQAYSDFLQAVELVEAQKKTVEEAEESLRLAEARFRAGTGTQLDVLSSQTALTEARSNEIQALYDYNVAIATLERATGLTAAVKL